MERVTFDHFGNCFKPLLLLLLFIIIIFFGVGGGGRGGRKELHLIILEGSFSFFGVCNYVNVGYPYPYFLIGF